jgi:hypothetical protein
MIVVCGIPMNAVQVQWFVFEKTGRMLYFQKETLPCKFSCYTEIGDDSERQILRAYISKSGCDYVLRLRDDLTHIRNWKFLTRNECEFGMTFEQFLR